MHLDILELNSRNKTYEFHTENNSSSYCAPMQWNDRLIKLLNDKGWSVPDLARSIGTPDEIPSLTERLYKYAKPSSEGGKPVPSPRGNMMAKIAAALGETEEYLRFGARTDSAASVVKEAILGPDVSEMRRGPRDVPVLGITVGGDTDDGDDRDPDFWLNGEVVNYVVRPAGLSHVKDLFSVYVQGESMWPRYEENDLVFLTKAAPAIGDDVVIELHKTSEGGDHATFVKRLVRRRGSYLTVRQYNPDKEIDFSMKEIKNLFRVIPTKEWVG
ncbi:helix-turn-helix transcriptional regulator [Tardiphaga sp.]|jgi:phage repressor protein C with HTH and peptisase S24 domain|uniref:helix-turn-helix transcriptional regulator n=1 Tax=Tardiphaga sp. TaxID=1926292 RepID=UPI0037D9ABFD